MPYKKSRARNGFEVTYIELLSLAKQISYKKVNLSYEHKNMIFQSSIILLCSSLEEYLRVFVEDIFYSYKANGATLSELPINPRTYTLFHKQKNAFEGFIFNRDEVKVLEKLDVSNSLYSIISDSNTLTNQIDSKMIVNDKKYPSPKNIKTLYNRLGIKKIFTEIDRIGHKNYEFILRSFLDIRETIAHQSSTDLTYEDIKRNFYHIKDLVDKLDRATYKHICIESGQKYWI